MIVAKIKDYFNSMKNISAVYLFGSVAKNKNRKDSDIDIAVLFSEGMDMVERFDEKLRIASELESIFHTKVDVIDLESADLFFVHKIMEEKILIVDMEVNRRVKFEVAQRRNFFDRQYFYKLYHECAMKRLEEME